MPSTSSSDAENRQWTVRVHAYDASEGQSLVVHGRNLMPLVGRLLADSRVQDIVVRPRAREVLARVREPASDGGRR